MPLRLLGGIRLDPVAARLAPYDQPDMGAAALPSVIGGPGGVCRRSALGASSLLGGRWR
jgi:hypothetical protein